MIISILVAMNEDLLIGVNNDLPWKLQDDLEHFKNYSLNKPIIMGRKTFESIGKPLPNRKNIIVSSRMDEQDGIKVYNNLYDAIAFCKKYNEENEIDEIILIGGAKIFAEGLKQSTKLVISWVDANGIKGDVYFPDFNKQEWKEVNSKKYSKSQVNQYDFEIKEYLRK
jgi:dihydrofolate reductase